MGLAGVMKSVNCIQKESSSYTCVLLLHSNTFYSSPNLISKIFLCKFRQLIRSPARFSKQPPYLAKKDVAKQSVCIQAIIKCNTQVDSIGLYLVTGIRQCVLIQFRNISFDIIELNFKLRNDWDEVGKSAHGWYEWTSFPSELVVLEI